MLLSVGMGITRWYTVYGIAGSPSALTLSLALRASFAHLMGRKHSCAPVHPTRHPTRSYYSNFNHWLPMNGTVAVKTSPSSVVSSTAYPPACVRVKSVCTSN